MAMTRDCKSLAFGLRRFESYFQHQSKIIDPSGSFFLCNGAVRAASNFRFNSGYCFSIGTRYLTGVIFLQKIKKTLSFLKSLRDNISMRVDGVSP